ncbi:hypothetical protein SEA_MARIOKART_58 [Gordonia phage Mariokart]|nr:hypothetical protein SEA_MARIOKART_58 [Gordonia phage Mariokart]
MTNPLPSAYHLGVPQSSAPATLVRAPSGVDPAAFRRRWKVACAELDMSYAEFVLAAIEAHEASKATMRHPLDRAAAR